MIRAPRRHPLEDSRIASDKQAVGTGRGADARKGRPAIVTDDDLRARAIADGSEPDAIVSPRRDRHRPTLWMKEVSEHDAFCVDVEIEARDRDGHTTVRRWRDCGRRSPHLEADRPRE